MTGVVGGKTGELAVDDYRHGLDAQLAIFVRFFAMGVRRWSTYRLAVAAGAFANTVFGLLRANITVAATAAAGGALGGYDAATVATYVWLGQAFAGAVNFFPWTELAARIRLGDVAVDLARPVDPQLAYLAADLGRAVFQLVPRGAPPLLVGAVVTGLVLPATPWPYALGVLSLLLAVSVSFACRWLVNLTAFWLLDLRGPMAFYQTAISILCGLSVPVHWFPGWLARVAASTPFPSMLQTPIDVVTGRIVGVDAVAAIGVQAAWLAGLLVLGQVVFRFGARRLVVQGG
ncbi:ABC transporter permease [Micromonospora sp. RP3T]|uniref:ABC transporter permease n=1 Tax=Micromonospora sp. RP3T TaxID=2135446 RepID=UPI003D747A8B